MKAEIKTRWLAELRDESNVKSVGALYSKVRGQGVKWSALGLLVKLAMADEIIEAAKKIPRKNNWFFGTCEGTLPKAVVKWAELSSSLPMVRTPPMDLTGVEIEKIRYPHCDNGEVSFLVHSLNDNGASFAQIADLIEAGSVQ